MNRQYTQKEQWAYGLSWLALAAVAGWAIGWGLGSMLMQIEHGLLAPTSIQIEE